MRTIRKLEMEEINSFVEIVTNAYPGFANPSPEAKERTVQSFKNIQENVETIDLYGLFEDEKLLGGMRFHHFTMNFYTEMIKLGGVGLVGVDLLHKKKKVAKNLIEFFIQYYRNQGIPLVTLYPFRPDFYKKMGFGYGTNMNQYEIEPASFPKGPTKEHIRFINIDEKSLIFDCFNRYAQKTHGMIQKTEYELENMFLNPENRIVGYEKDGIVKGYLMFSFKKKSETNFGLNDMLIKELVYEEPTVFSEICTFLHSQADQIRRMILNTQDEAFHFLLHDPRNGSNHLIPSVYHESYSSGVGIMYRVTDVKKIMEIFKKRRFYGMNCQFKITVNDNLMKENSCSLIVSLDNGKLSVSDYGDSDTNIMMDIAEFSSLIMGAVDFESLFMYGRIQMDNTSHLEAINSIFLTKRKPICMTGF